MAAKRKTRVESAGSQRVSQTHRASAPVVESTVVEARHFGDGPSSMSLSPIALAGNAASVLSEPGSNGNGSVERSSQWDLFSSGLFRATFDPGGREKITRPYEENIFVHSALKVKSTAASSVDLKFWKDNQPDAEEVADEDEFVQLFKKPNPLMSAAKFWTAHLIHRALDGEDFWFMVDDSGQQIEPGQVPSAIWPVRGAIVQIHKRAPNGVPIQWKYAGADGRPRIFDEHAVVHYSEYNPNDPTRGLGTVKVLARAMELMFLAERYQSGVLNNGGDPGGIVAYKKRIGSRAEKDRLEGSIDDLFSDPANRGKHIVLDQDATYTPNKLSSKDMEFATLWKEMRGTILGSLGVPPPNVGVYDDATYNNLLEAKRDLWLGGLGVLTHLTCVERDMDADFWPRFPDQWSRYVARFDVSSVEALTFANLEKLAEARALVRTGAALSWNDAFEMVQLELNPPKNADVVWLDGKMIPVGEITGGAEGSELTLSTEEVVGGTDEGAERTEPDGGQAPEPVEPGDESDSTSGFDGMQMSVALDLVRDVEAKRLSQKTGAETLALLLGIDVAAAKLALGDAGSKGTETIRLALDTSKKKEAADGDAKVDERAAFVLDIEERLFKPGDVLLFPPIRRWFRNKLSAWLRRMDAVAQGRKSMTALLEAAEVKLWTEELLTRKAPTASQLADLLMLDEGEWKKKLADLFGPKAAKVWAKALGAAKNDIGGEAILPTDPSVLKLLNQQTIKLSEGVNSALTKRVRKAMMRVFESEDFPDHFTISEAIGEVLPKLKNGVRQSVGQIEARSMAIARTESAKAANSARYLQMGEADVKKSEWVSAGDNAVRHSHERVDGQVRKLGKRFTNGLKYPTDPNGPASEVVNCRCVARAAK